MKDAGFSSQNVAYGMGGGLLQKVNRDTMQFATKLCHITYADGTVRDVMKNPKTSKSKQSLPGELAVIESEQGVKYCLIISSLLLFLHRNLMAALIFSKLCMIAEKFLNGMTLQLFETG